jgi:acetylornithine aminotransferase
MGALSMTGQPGKREAFRPLIPNIEFIEFNNIDAAKKAITDEIAMVIVEPIQGENGVIPASEKFLRELRRLTNKTGALLCIDAVQTGMGRTGQWFGYEHSGITPDIITLAKGLGGGLSLGAMIRLGNNAPHFTPGTHGSTFGGNPVACAASLATIEIIKKKKLLSCAENIFETLEKHLAANDAVEQIRGRGALVGIVLKAPQAKAVALSLKEQGVLIGTTSEYVIRLAPPLNLSHKEMSIFLRKFSKAVNAHAL